MTFAISSSVEHAVSAALMVAAAMMLSCGPIAQTQPRAAPKQEPEPLVCKVEHQARGSADVSTGTAFLVDGKHGVFATAAHVVRKGCKGPKHRSVRMFCGGELRDGWLVGCKIERDVAFVETSWKNQPTPAMHRDAGLKAGDEVMIPGFPMLDILGETNQGGFSRVFGRVSVVGRDIKTPDGATLPRLLQVQAFADTGSSGSPVLDQRRRIIGMVSMAENKGVFLFAVPIQEVLAEKDAVIGNGS